MGAVNYFTSDYITMGLKPYDFEDCKKSYLEWAATEAPDLVDDECIDDIVNEYMAECYNDDYENIKTELEKHCFIYYHVTIKPGYYCGFTLDIENNFGVAYNDWTDRAEAQKEITEIKQFLIDCAGLGLVACFPGWCTGYDDYNGTIKAINEAVKTMRDEAKHTPTWRQYLIDCGEWKKEA